MVATNAGGKEVMIPVVLDGELPELTGLRIFGMESGALMRCRVSGAGRKT